MSLATGKNLDMSLREDRRSYLVRSTLVGFDDALLAAIGFELLHENSQCLAGVARKT